MAKHRGRGMASINYPIGMNLGGDPSQALVHSNPDGKFTVTLSAIDLGQGMKQVTRQIAAETLGVPIADVYVDTADSDTGPHDMGSFASRGTHRVGNAVMVAAKEARGVMMEAAAEELEVNAADLETDGRGNIHVSGAPSRAIAVKDVAIAAQFRQGKTIAGRGIFLIPLSEVNPETGEMSPVSCYAHACLVADLEVDDETGEVTMLKMTSAYELGRAINPKMVEQQLVGGAWMGMSHALYETPEPYYPDIAHGPRDFNEYVMPGPGDICPHDIAVLERPAPDGPFGGKGPGEMCANPVLPAVANAIFNAVGVRIDELPITPEKVLRAIKAQGGARPQGAAGRAALVMHLCIRQPSVDRWSGLSRPSIHPLLRRPWTSWILGDQPEDDMRCRSGTRPWSCAPKSPASTAPRRWRTRSPAPSIWPTTASPRPPTWRWRSASRCCWKARRASARPRPPRRSRACWGAA